GKDHWLTLRPLEHCPDIQGKVNIEVRFEQVLGADGHMFHRLAVKVLQSKDLLETNGICNPYAVVRLSYNNSQTKDDVHRTSIKRKTTHPKFNETFIFDIEKHAGQQNDRKQQFMYIIEDPWDSQLSVSLWHDDSRLSQGVFTNLFQGVFLGEIKIHLKEIQNNKCHNAWYYLQNRVFDGQDSTSCGSLRVKIHYTVDHVFPPNYYDNLLQLLCLSHQVEPISSSAANILGQIAPNMEDAAQPLVKIFLCNGNIVQFIQQLVKWEIANTVDVNTLFRGNTLLSKCIDELMKLLGQDYLLDTLQPIISEIETGQKDCEIDPTRLPDMTDPHENMENLEYYVSHILDSITQSSLSCPVLMCSVFEVLKDSALEAFSDKSCVRYQVVSGFIFLRFFAPAILGPRLFKLCSNNPSAIAQRNLLLISKTIQSLGNYVGAQNPVFSYKEEYMVPLFTYFTESRYVNLLKQYLDEISTNRLNYVQDSNLLLMEGMMHKRNQHKNMLFPSHNFQKRHFTLSMKCLAHSKNKGDVPSSELPMSEILAAESVDYSTFNMHNVIQVIQPENILYIQAASKREESQWLSILTKMSNSNMREDKPTHYHSGVYINNHWTCCMDEQVKCPGCKRTTSGLSQSICDYIHQGLELEKIHTLFLQNINQLELLQDACAVQEVYMGDNMISPPSPIEDTRTCFLTVSRILDCIVTLEQEHQRYRKTVNRTVIYGSEEFPFDGPTNRNLPQR
ncbi:unnamed protein product, partial [Owenia fusiformis]